MRAERESDGGKKGRGCNGVGESGPGSLHLVGRLRASKEPPQYTKLALCEISGGHREGPAALFSQSEPVCFLWASEPEPVRRAACWQEWKLCWVAPSGETGGLLHGGPGVSGAPQHLPLI